jgi:uncharacterized C2H2 Zn-finger protein
MKPIDSLRGRILDRAAELLLERILADEPTKGKPDAVIDGDGDLHCPDCPDRVFVTKRAYRQHRTKTHKEPKESKRGMP